MLFVMQEFAQLPPIFGRYFNSTEPTNVLFRYPFNTTMHVTVQKIGNGVFFIEGWIDILYYYNTLEGAWIKLYYLGWGFSNYLPSNIRF